MMRSAGPQDAIALDAYLRNHAASSMFLRGNLADHGTLDQTHRHGTTFHLWEMDQTITAVIAITNSGYLMCQAPDATAAFWLAACQALSGKPIEGMTGPPDQIDHLIDVLKFASDDFSLRQVTPLYQLALTRLCSPSDPNLTLRRPEDQDVVWLADWHAGFLKDTRLQPPTGQTFDQLALDFIAKPDARLLLKDGEPVAMSTFNARTADMVQVGGVYVPPRHRGMGYGGAIVALHLVQARAAGIEMAILFAANSFAANAYEGIGFTQIGKFEIAQLKVPKMVTP